MSSNPSSTTKLRMVVTGRHGQVVSSLIKRAGSNDRFSVSALGRPELDLSRPETIASAIAAAQPDIIVSAAAYTAVDQAETDETEATLVNGTAAGIIAKTAQSLGIPVIHISTDYVFDGSKTSPYVEADTVSPLGAYGRSKLAGERTVAENNPNHVILRTAWVYSSVGKNFLKTMIRLAGTRETINVVADQFGNPTSADDIADGILTVAANLVDSADPKLRGTFHMTGTGEASWADFASEIFSVSKRLGGPNATVEKIPLSAYPTPAKRPENSRLDCGLLKTIHNVALPDWKTSTAAVVAELSDKHFAQD
ncbi:dTDP-4-dehydrorhamnose reductase [Agrobacterium larrymoorei]|uniref:dTDP-4-dehydrorhamnose reductase n=1 Tax=Agrobacterium larrymoorei TaxID=160699 RepID=UPI001571DDE5|nr:dTDP-4-dehydrorhamnose reductase [Agrobacterium larrymoorei]NTJ43938.1 dTDP-4-dehydrorhamnose reductase [Agrobacterium larrymoorei]